MNIQESQHSISIEDLEEIDEEIGSELPQSFKDFYISHNGGYPEENYVRGISELFSFNSFFSIKYGRVTIEMLLRDIDYLPPGCFFPFANDSGGNIFFMSLKDGDFGKIFLVTCDTHDIFLVQNSFSDFLRSLYFEDE